MDKYDFNTVYDRKGSGCYKADALKMLFGKEDLLSLWVADMDFAIAPEVQAALQKRLEHPIFGYNFRLAPYYAAIIDWIDKKYRWQINKEWIINTPGIVTALNVAVVVLTNPGDNIIVQMPVYDPFFDAVQKHGRTLLTNSLLLTGGRYEIDFADLEQKLKISKLFFLCNPHNPVGRVWTRDELLQIGRLCKKHGVIVIADEIHADLVFNGHQHVAFGSLEDFADFTIACYSPSKSFNLAGLCTSAVVIPDKALRKPVYDFVQSMHLYLGNSFGIVALQAAYTQGESWLNELVAYLESNRDYLCAFFARYLPHLNVIKPEGTYLAWIDFRSLEISDADLNNLIVNRAGLALSMGRTYGEDGTGFVRLNFGCPRSRLEQACEKLYATFKKG
jgi:cystathionine beta-lyase